MSDDAIERHIEIDAPVDVVWRTITEPEQITKWFADVVEIEARPGASGSLTFRAASDDPYTTGISVVDVEPPHRFSFRWVHPPGVPATEVNSSLVTFTLAADGVERTRLRVVESGIDQMQLTEEEKEKFLDAHRHGWQVQGDRLRNLLADGHAPPR